jgi:peroxiredoxin
MKKFITLFSLVLLGSFFYYHHVQAQGVEVGGPAAPFDLKNIDGTNISLDNYAMDDEVEGVILIFTCNHCPYAKMYEDRIVALDKAYKSQGFPVVAINPNDPAAYPEDDFANMKKRAKQKGFTFPYLVDETQDVAREYGATKTPHVFLLAKNDDNSFRVSYIGAIDDSPQSANKVDDKFLENAIAALKSNTAPDPATTKAVGCSIKWKE